MDTKNISSKQQLDLIDSLVIFCAYNESVELPTGHKNLYLLPGLVSNRVDLWFLLPVVRTDSTQLPG